MGNKYSIGKPEENARRGADGPWLLAIRGMYGVIPSGAVVQAEGGISRCAHVVWRFLGPLRQTRALGMTPSGLERLAQSNGR